MSRRFSQMECSDCGATAFEVPDETGRTWCANCGAEASAQTEDDDSEDRGESADDLRSLWSDSLPADNPSRSRYGRGIKTCGRKQRGPRG